MSFQTRLAGLIALLCTLGVPTGTNHQADAAVQPPAAPPAPNIIIVIADDLGYADLSCYGAEISRTPNLDQMAADGVRLTSYYAGSPACSPARAAILTGCYPQRVGMPGVLSPNSKTGLHPDETTIADMLRARGYATAAVGKWHLGDAPETLPLAHGFDTYFGLPYSNDMWPYHYGDHDRGLIGNPNWPDLPLLESTAEDATHHTAYRTVELNPRQHTLTPRYLDRSLAFIDQQADADRPFFLYLALSHPHVPIAASDAFRGTTGRGLYADMIAEIDDAVGRLRTRLEDHGLTENTLIIFTSDNGPWTRFGSEGGSTGPLRGTKGTSFEGGVRVPFIAAWPGVIPAGHESDHIVAAMDVLPTIGAWTRPAGGDDAAPTRKIDGFDMGPLLTGGIDEADEPIRSTYLYYWPGQLHAVRSGDWKLVLPHRHRFVVEQGAGGQPGREEMRPIGLSLFNLREDLGETTNLAQQHPEIVARLQQLAEAARADLGDDLTQTPGPGRRAPLRRGTQPD